MTTTRRMDDGRWVPAEPLPEVFSVTWERCWRTRRERGEWLAVAVCRGWLDARAICRLAAGR